MESNRLLGGMSDFLGIDEYVPVEENVSSHEGNTEVRRAEEKAIAQKLREIHAIKERLYQMRYDQTHTKEETSRHVMNLSRELVRLEEEFLLQRNRSFNSFQKSLKLEDIGLDKHSLTHLLEKRLDDSGAEPDEITFMRTQSTHTLKDQTPAQKWHSLYKMFREFKYHKAVAHASYEIALDEQSMKLPVDQQIKLLRTAIYELNQRKSLTTHESELLGKLRDRLKTLTEFEEQ